LLVQREWVQDQHVQLGADVQLDLLLYLLCMLQGCCCLPALQIILGRVRRLKSYLNVSA
jgi:hypothetical protein